MNNQPLRIAIFTAVYAPFLSGISIAVHQRVRWLLQQGHEVFLIHPQINDQYPKEVCSRPMLGLDELKSFPKFSAYAYPTKPLFYYKSAPEPLHHKHWSDTKLLENFQPDVVLVEEATQMRGFYSLFWGGYGRAIGTEYAHQTGTPTVSLFHTNAVGCIQYFLGNSLSRLIQPIIPLVSKRFSEAYDINFFSSKEQLAQYKKMQVKRGVYLPYQGVDCQKFHPKNICYDPIPDDHRPTMLFVGRITPEKNVTQLLDIYSIIAAKIPDIHLVIVGSGPQDEKIRRLAQKFKSGVTIWGESHGTELLGWFARADIFVNPSFVENFCTTNNEALASGTPVVTTFAPSTSEQIFPSVNGFLAEPNNPKDFAEKVITILSNPDLKEEMSLRSRKSILEFDWSRCMEKLEEKLYQLVEASKPSEVLSVSSRKNTKERVVVNTLSSQ
ncbi:glycosyltransferase family 4 protein [Nodularia spumigena]|uniref:glycosyltransferase family 4 protein n=1 Tax=Nodularia spumigena TaxID=70799 RepID=UPI0023313954|nr:glycosyltransferase family 4 protein [Nodularia spumigena]MDB9316259.1 glycosyltransferase family 4 protein [Nodularia spumigena CS-590/01A]MDB9320380.1 glycosyltransferase family 4 protein [Nodularia spumigena CS-591/07A]MDB9326935.1 glycosyltransferase family 4 protein [Nodularia spumigena CS-590/02]MDB9330400.1 glycosyltransferase family 4 protein [Nodularia spumigena CS-591/04]MDB9335718.1 glycosyltransferase family 4 protein [Nodularia spumigena CS-590/01]